MIHIALSMANNTQSPYFSRFAKLAQNIGDIKLSFLCMFEEEPKMIGEMKSYGFDCYWIKFDTNHKLKFYPYAFKQGYQLIKRLKPDILHTHLFDDSFVLLPAANLAGVKHRIITKLDSGYHHLYKPSWVKFDKLNNRLATNIIAVSGENRDFIIQNENADKKKISLIHQGLQIEEVTKFNDSERRLVVKRFNISESDKVILNVARFVDIKGHRYIIEAADSLVKSYPELKFIFVGYGEKENVIRESIVRKGLDKNIQISGWIDRGELNALYSFTDIYVHASISEPFGYVIAEAMMNEIPVVATNTGAAQDVITHLDNGYLTSPKSSLDIAEGIEFMLNSSTDELLEMKKKSKAIAQKSFTMEQMWNQHLALYKKLLRN